ncbi:MAG TPA: CocE/NonD family hydrolase [Polyangiales bacterium]|nr:CocE/NonD family hydrolase [Polyangiales bacterium]
MRDGTKLAVDVYRPQDANGQMVDKPLPVVWLHTPFNRRTYAGGPTIETYPGFASRLVSYGYVVATVDYRGLYASYGTNLGHEHGEWFEPARWDAFDITEWLATQPWSNGRIGMYGCGASASSQLQAASTMPPHLQAIFPMSCEFDAYADAAPGGTVAPKGTPPVLPAGNVPAAQREALAAPIDGDESRSMLQQATAQQTKNVESPGYVPFRDSVGETIPKAWWSEISPASQLEPLQASKVAIYYAANWDDASKYGSLLAFSSLRNASKLIVGPGKGCDWAAVKTEHGFDLLVEELRFFDYWLKDVDNQLVVEPPVYFYTYNAPSGMEWQASARWPPMNEQRTRYYLGEKALLTGAPPDGKDEIAVDYAPTATGLVYDTEPLAMDVQITGHPSMDLWVSSTADDGDFVATISDVAPDGTARSYNVSGRIRASHRKLAQAPYNNLGLPWHRSFQQDAMPLKPGEPAQLLFDLQPVSQVFKAGNRIRLSLTFAAGTATPRIDPPPTVTIYRDSVRRSAVVLPVLAARVAP